MNEMSQVAGDYASPFKTRYDNFIGGTFVAPVGGKYFDNITPITGQKVCEVALSDAQDVELALDAAHAAKKAWGKTAAAERSNILLKIADRMEENLDLLGREDEGPSGFERAERAAVKRALARSGGNVSAAARALGIGRATLYRRMNRLGLDDPG